MFYSKFELKVFSPEGLSSSEVKSRAKYMWIVIAALTVASIALGYQAFTNYVRSEQSLKAAKAEFTEIGKVSDAQQCVKSALGWLPKCEGLFSLCEQSVPELMTICLSQQNRSEMCSTMASDFRSTKFGAKECVSFGLPKNFKKSCGLAFRQIDNYCHSLSKSTSKKAL